MKQKIYLVFIILISSSNKFLSFKLNGKLKVPDDIEKVISSSPLLYLNLIIEYTYYKYFYILLSSFSTKFSNKTLDFDTIEIL